MTMSVGLICEFNPFHYGHQYIIRKIIELTGEPVICAMSGPFVQRGEAACVNKFTRTKAALMGGADAVIELPVKFAISSARNFARGGIKILQNISDLSALAFGVETDKPELLYEIAQLKKNSHVDEQIKIELNGGVSYPTALSKVIAKFNENYSEILNKPNNILAIEYIETLEGTSIRPLPVRRIGNSYNDEMLSGGIPSATAIRKNLYDDALTRYMPQQMLDDCRNEKIDYDLLDNLILYSLRKMSVEEIANLPDVENGLEYTIYNAALNCVSLKEAMEEIKTKRYTYARLKRIFLYALLGINRLIMSDIISTKARLLGIKKEFKTKLNCLNSNIITRNSDIKNKEELKIDAFADDIYSMITGKKGNLYYTSPLIIV